MNKGRNITKAFEFVRRFYGEVAQLASKLDDLMEHENWRSARGNTVTSLVSKDLLKPELWLPDSIFRLYENRKVTALIKGIVIYFISEDLTEPILIMGTIKYRKRKEAQDWDIWNLWIANERRSLNKDYAERDSVANEPYVHEGVIDRACLYAINLMNIKSEEDIKTKIFNKLMQQK